RHRDHPERHAFPTRRSSDLLAQVLPPADAGIRRAPQTSRPAPGLLGEALRNLQRYVQNETFDNPQGGQTTPGASIQFDTKGVERSEEHTSELQSRENLVCRL